jgi:two-component system response regulator HydG
LAEHFLDRYSRETNKYIDIISKEAMTLLRQYDWPGNVRELENAIERAVVISKKRRLGPEEFSFLAPHLAAAAETYSLEKTQIAHIHKVLKEFDWNITKAAEALEINRVTLHKKIKKHELRPDRASK